MISMTTVYQTTKRMLHTENEGRAIPVYGIACHEDGKVRYLRDISPQKDYVEYITTRLNQYAVPYIHFYDIVEDTIC